MSSYPRSQDGYMRTGTTPVIEEIEPGVWAVYAPDHNGVMVRALPETFGSREEAEAAVRSSD